MSRREDTAPSLRALRAQAAPATVENDRGAACYRVTAPPGRRFEPGLHELVSWYQEAVWMPEAREALAEMLADPTYGVEDCDDPDCDWCADARADGGDR
jgi:hypothetical protein